METTLHDGKMLEIVKIEIEAGELTSGAERSEGAQQHQPFESFKFCANLFLTNTIYGIFNLMMPLLCCCARVMSRKIQQKNEVRSK